MLRSVVERLRAVNTKWWWHELSLIQKIGLEGTEEKTARELLYFVIQRAKDMDTSETMGATSNFDYEEARFGSVEEFRTTQ